jgi:hypothetical protein
MILEQKEEENKHRYIILRFGLSDDFGNKVYVGVVGIAMAGPLCVEDWA